MYSHFLRPRSLKESILPECIFVNLKLKGVILKGNRIASPAKVHLPQCAQTGGAGSRCPTGKL